MSFEEVVRKRIAMFNAPVYLYYQDGAIRRTTGARKDLWQAKRWLAAFGTELPEPAGDSRHTN